MEVTADMVLPSGDLPAYAWPGGYTLIYYVPTERGGIEATLCAKCATVERSKGYKINPLLCDVYYEGPDETCDECGAIMESSYGDPDE